MRSVRCVLLSDENLAEPVLALRALWSKSLERRISANSIGVSFRPPHAPSIVVCALLLKEAELIREIRALLAPRYVQAVIRLVRMTAVTGGTAAQGSLLVENERLLMAGRCRWPSPTIGQMANFEQPRSGRWQTRPAKATFPGHISTQPASAPATVTPMMQQNLSTSPDESVNDVPSDHVHPNSMAANYAAGTHRNTLPPTAW